jgi:predicted DNA-binding protein (MmcQ/YjbR family)
MNVEELRDYCISMLCVTESFPFDQTTLVFKVGQKVFVLTSLERQLAAVNLKCDPEKALD